MNSLGLRQLLWVAAAAGLGSLAAVSAVVTARTISQPALVNGITLGVTVLWVAAVAIVAPDADPARRPAYTVSGPVPGPPPPPAFAPPPAPAPAPARAPAPAPAPARAPAPPPPQPRAEPAPRPPDASTWYEAAARGVAGQGTAPPPSVPPTAEPRPGHPEPAGPRPAYVRLRWGQADDKRVDLEQIVQCPRCGTFAVEAQPVRQGCTFACGGCGHQWNLRPTDPWPVTVVRPRLVRPGPGDASTTAGPVWRMDV